MDILRTRGGGFRCTFFCKKLRIFRNLCYDRSPHGRRGRASMDIFRTRSRCQFFAILYRRPLISI